MLLKSVQRVIVRALSPGAVSISAAWDSAIAAAPAGPIKAKAASSIAAHKQRIVLMCNTSWFRWPETLAQRAATRQLLTGTRRYRALADL